MRSISFDVIFFSIASMGRDNSSACSSYHTTATSLTSITRRNWNVCSSNTCSDLNSGSSSNWCLHTRRDLEFLLFRFPRFKHFWYFDSIERNISIVPKKEVLMFSVYRQALFSLFIFFTTYFIIVGYIGHRRRNTLILRWFRMLQLIRSKKLHFKLSYLSHNFLISRDLLICQSIFEVRRKESYPNLTFN